MLGNEEYDSVDQVHLTRKNEDFGGEKLAPWNSGIEGSTASPCHLDSIGQKYSLHLGIVKCLLFRVFFVKCLAFSDSQSFGLSSCSFNTFMKKSSRVAFLHKILHAENLPLFATLWEGP